MTNCRHPTFTSWNSDLMMSFCIIKPLFQEVNISLSFGCLMRLNAQHNDILGPYLCLVTYLKMFFWVKYSFNLTHDCTYSSVNRAVQQSRSSFTNEPQSKQPNCLSFCSTTNDHPHTYSYIFIISYVLIRIHLTSSCKSYRVALSLYKTC